MRNRLWSILLCAALVVFFAGCAEMQVKKTDADQKAGADTKAVEKQSAAVKQSGAGQEAAAAPAAGAAAVAKDKKAKQECLSYVVKKGDSLWFIAGYKDIYGDSYLWPLIHKANKKKIKNPNRIYPGQKLIITRAGVTMDAVKKARKMAGAPKPYTPPSGATPPVS